MDTHTEAIWNRGNAREIMREARKRFREELAKGNHTSAHTALASAHYSLVKRYLSPAPIRVRHLAVWHMWRAAVHANEVRGSNLDFDQVDVVSTILSKAPWWLGGDASTALSLVTRALINERDYGMPMVPHTKAFFLIRRAEIYMKWGMHAIQVEGCYDAASRLLPDITDERQKCRVLSAIGFFEFDTLGVNYGQQAIAEALGIAHRVSRDQYDKILTEAWKRGMDLDLLNADAGVIHGMSFAT